MKVVRTNKQEVVVVHDNLTEDRARGMVEEAVRCAKCVTVENYGSLHKIDVYHHGEERESTCSKYPILTQRPRIQTLSLIVICNAMLELNKKRQIKTD